MDHTELPCNKIFGYAEEHIKNKVPGLPIKKCHYLEGKYFIVIDKSIIEQLGFSGYKNTELYFHEEVTNDGSIILRPYKLRE
jgi:hypothetical protein